MRPRPFVTGGQSIRRNATILQLDPEEPDEEGREIDRLAQEGQPAIDEALQRQFQAVTANLDPARLDDLERILSATKAGDLQEALARLMREAAGAGVRVTAAKLGQVAIGVNWQLANEAARTWAAQYSYALVSRLNENSRRMLQDAVGRWVASGEPLDALIEEIARVFGPVRGEMIAVTEATRAYAEGCFTTYEQAGFNRRPPEERRPPAHVRCRCWVSLRESDPGVWEYVWLTAQDELVCPVCAPKHLTSIGFAGRK